MIIPSYKLSVRSKFIITGYVRLKKWISWSHGWYADLSWKFNSSDSNATENFYLYLNENMDGQLVT